MIHLETLSAFISKNKKNDLEKLCNNHLAYLIDSGYDVSVNEKHSGIYPLKSVHYSIIIVNKGFKWEDIKYDFMTFLEILTNSYKIDKKHIRFYHKSNNFFFPEMHTDYNKEQILNDNIDSDIEIFQIEIKIK
jgi:hypothetical protein